MASKAYVCAKVVNQDGKLVVDESAQRKYMENNGFTFARLVQT